MHNLCDTEALYKVNVVLTTWYAIKTHLLQSIYNIRNFVKSSSTIKVYSAPSVFIPHFLAICLPT